MSANLRLKPGREKSLLRRHPWIFSGAVLETRPSQPGMGETVPVLSSSGDFLALAAYSPNSKIRARVWDWDENTVIGESFFSQRIQRAVDLRNELRLPLRSSAFRLVHGESDGLPGLVVDRYNDTLVVQFLSAGVELWRDQIIAQLALLTCCDSIYERSDQEVRALEGLEIREGQIIGSLPDNPARIEENGFSFWVDLRSGHKTGFYLDQRANRLRLRQLAAGRQVLDCFAYTGGFSVNALAGGAAHVIAVDSSGAALELAARNIGLNKLFEDKIEFIRADVFQLLRAYRDQARSFDLIVLDPPKFAPTISQVERAARGYKDINLLAFKLLRPGGYLMTYSCSGGVDEELFQKIVAGAALDAGVSAKIVERLHQDVDHPVALNFPEGSYLKGFILKVE